MNNADYIDLIGIVNDHKWELFTNYLKKCKQSEYDNLATCSEVSLKSIQSKIALYNDLLTLRDTVNKINGAR